ncbi:sensor domain-containing protein [uncultured Agrococcus sp.]|uniref:sensor histidine kinase n=1 Tax=uncultured Agrococcus sp. TaxID=382258 RepID=UPI0025ED9063|nr:sensor domain-containing protein [uncultured Agrococcus sp.]
MADQPTAGRSKAIRRLKWAMRAFGQLTWGMGTGLLALITFVLGIAVAISSLVGVGILLIRPWLVLLRAVADLERSRLTNQGYEVISPYEQLPQRLRDCLEVVRTDQTTQRDLMWLPVHATWGLIASFFGFQAGINVLREISFPLWWHLLPADEATTLNGLIRVNDWSGAAFSVALGVVWLAVFLFLNPAIVQATAAPGLRLLTAHPDVDLTARIAQLTTTRAAALDAHAVELRRIERALHDGAQNRLVGVAMLTGAAQEALRRDSDSAEAMMEQAHAAAEQALAELRSVVRGILPPILEDRGLAGALNALASSCAVECSVDVDVPVRCPASVESTAYFAAAEALTNISKHSGAYRATLTVRRSQGSLLVVVDDDGRGGAKMDAGSGLAGISRRVAAHDGRTEIQSPVGGPTRIEVELPCGL